MQWLGIVSFRIELKSPTGKIQELSKTGRKEKSLGGGERDVTFLAARNKTPIPKGSSRGDCFTVTL